MMLVSQDGGDPCKELVGGWRVGLTQRWSWMRLRVVFRAESDPGHLSWVGIGLFNKVMVEGL